MSDRPLTAAEARRMFEAIDTAELERAARLEVYKPLRCDQDRTCTDPVSHVDSKGYVYCRRHGVQRRGGGIGCRQLTAAERRQLERGGTIRY